MEQTNPYLQAFRGFFTNMLRWDDMDRLVETLLAQADDGWYVYAVGETPPATPASTEQFATVVRELNALLRRDHDEDYCGIVYVDNPETPTFVKIYDPHNLGSVCGSGTQPPPLPGWVLSRLAPVDLQAATMPAANRRRWWQKLFS